MNVERCLQNSLRVIEFSNRPTQISFQSSGRMQTLQKMKALLDSSEGKAAEAAHTVVGPIEIYIEVEGGK